MSFLDSSSLLQLEYQRLNFYENLRGTWVSKTLVPQTKTKKSKNVNLFFFFFWSLPLLPLRKKNNPPNLWLNKLTYSMEWKFYLNIHKQRNNKNPNTGNEPNGEPSSKPTNPSNKIDKLKRWNPRTQARTEPTNPNLPNPNPLAWIEPKRQSLQVKDLCRGFLFLEAKVLFSSISIFLFICVEQELKSLILKFHTPSWKSNL